MIRINLLGTAKAKGKRASAAASAVAVLEAGDSGSPMLKVAIALVLAVGFNGWTWYHLDKNAQDDRPEHGVGGAARTANWPRSRPSIWSGSARPTTTSAGWT